MLKLLIINSEAAMQIIILQRNHNLICKFFKSQDKLQDPPMVTATCFWDYGWRCVRTRMEKRPCIHKAYPALK